MEDLLKQEVYGTELHDTNKDKCQEVNIIYIQRYWLKNLKKFFKLNLLQFLNPYLIQDMTVLNNPTTSQESLQM